MDCQQLILNAYQWIFAVIKEIGMNALKQFGWGLAAWAFYAYLALACISVVDALLKIVFKIAVVDGVFMLGWNIVIVLPIALYAIYKTGGRVTDMRSE